MDQAIVLLLAIFAISFALCQETVPLATSNKNFALNFYNQLSAEPKTKGKNLVYSPYSIQMAGALLYAGAGGKTASEMVTGFNLPSSDPKDVAEIFKNSLDNHFSGSLFKIANKIYIAPSYTIAPTYADIVTKSYKSGIENLNFASEESVGIINNWVEEKTNGKIQNLLSELDADTVLLLINAIHFKGNWKQKFNDKGTTVKDFHTAPTQVIKTEMMHNIGDFKTGQFAELGIRVAEIPFKDSDVSMFILLPDSLDKSLDEVEAKLPDIIFKHDIFNKIKIKNYVALSLPKFKIETETDLEDILKNLFITSLFGPNADLQKLLSPPQSLHVSKALHKASIEVNEEGAEAAAATAIELAYHSAVSRKEIPFEINQSFLYFIKGGNGEIYFMGRYTGK